MRWKMFIPAIVIVIIAIVINLFFLDSILKAGFIKTNQMIFDAKVEVDSLDFKLHNLSIEIKGYRVADKDAPMKNLFDIERLHADIMPLPLLEKKIVIRETALENINFGTERRKSGALKKKTKVRKQESGESKDALRASKDKDKSRVPKVDLDVDKMFSSMPVSDLTDTESLETVKLVDNLKVESKAKSEEWENKINGFTVDNEINNTKTSVNDLKNIKKIETLSDISQVQTKIENLNNSKNAIKNKLSEVNTMKVDFDKDKNLYSPASITKKINDAKSLDYDKALNAANLKQFNVKNMAQSIFGSSILSKINIVEKWMIKIRKIMAKMKSQKPEEKIKKSKKSKGVDIAFPKDKGYPRFLIKKINLSGQTKLSDGNLFSVAGNIKGLTTDQDLYGQPLTINITAASSTSESSDISIDGVFDYRNNKSKELAKVMIKNISLNGMSFGSGSLLPPPFKSGKGLVILNISSEPDYFLTELDIKLKDVKFEKRDEETKKLQKIVDDIYSSMNLITLKGRIEKKETDTNMKLSSNLDSYFNKSLNNILKKRLNAAKARIKQQIDNKINEILSENKGAIYGNWDDLSGSLNDKQNRLNSELTNADDQIQQKKQMIKNKQNEEKKKAEKKVKSKAKEATSKALNKFLK